MTTEVNEQSMEPAPTTRLIIEKMELHNFKSYAGTQTIGPFHESDVDTKNNTVPGSEIIISRAAYSNGSSKYFINHSTSSLSEAKKDESVNYVIMENDLALKKNALFQLKLSENEIDYQKVQASYDEVQSRFNLEQKNTFNIKEEIKSLELQFKQSQKDHEKTESGLKDLTKEQSKIEREEVQLIENQKHLKNKLKKLEKSFEEMKQSIVQNQDTEKRSISDIEKANKDLIELENNLVSSNKELQSITDQLKGKTEKFTEQIREKQKDLEPWRIQISSQKSKLEVIRTEIELIQSKYNKSDNQVEKAENELLEIRKYRSLKDKEMSDQVEEFGELEIKIEQSKGRIDELKKRDSETNSKLHSSIQAEEEAKTSISASNSQNTVLKSLLKERDLGRISGIYGRLGSLGTIDNKFDIAISTSCPNLESIVVQNVSSGQQCVEFLRRNNIGRARFIMLDELQKFDLSPKQFPEGSQRLFDLVKPSDPKFAPAFFHALGNTLVTNNLEQARKIAYGGSQRFRVVTLDGKLIDSSGTMSGGGSRIIKGAMSSVPRRDDITPQKLQLLTEARVKLENEAHNLSSLIQQSFNELKLLNSRYSILEQELPKTEMDLKSSEERVQECKKQLAQLKSQITSSPSKSDIKELSALEKKAKEIENGISQLQAECSSIELEIKSLNNEIMQAGGVKLRSQKAIVNSINDQIQLVNENIDTYESTRSRSTAEIARLLRNLEKKREEKDVMVSQCENIEVLISQKRAELEIISTKVNEVKFVLEEKSEALEKLKGTFDSRQEEFNKIRTNEAQLKMEIEDTERALAENKRRSNYWKGELGRLQLQTIPEEIELSEPQPQSLPKLLSEALEELDPISLDKEISQLSSKLENSKPNLSVIAEYARRTVELNGHQRELDRISEERDSASNKYSDLHKQRLNTFMEGFNIISYKLKEMYQLITMGGSAELELVDSLDPFVEGILFSVMPPKKSWKNISDLSGGEKTLSSLALVFALHHFKPTPIYVMDEIDAALDFRNVSIVANYIKQRTENAQFIVISLRNNMFELADWLVGIYKTDNKTKSITLNPLVSEKLLKS
ncbi:Structural maintenance of chromosomes protein 4 [Smittium culicis]|uniref:Structural maintenance of chromosomes protein 4 n=1 Tax=Smittium culicis TaxID=133412 RepID=A0A1R1YSN9_9FUNG|nr:Structural maintenance of chromosomes protein 4 [Smittium culicis]